MGVRRICVAARRALCVLCLFAPFAAAAVEASSRYRSPRNPERSVRKSTELIVLHTTEAPARSSLNKLSERGEAHYCVTEEGRIYRIVDRDREAFHAGWSMWRGKEDVDKFSIGIECVGYHNKPMNVVQLAALRSLVNELKAIYGIPDDRVVSHCHVAYGAPNKWHKRKHRGRKRCGMLFVMPSVRQVLGLKSRPKSDPDVAAKRLVVGDDYLCRALYGNVDTMRAHYPSPASGRKRKPLLGRAAARAAKGRASGGARPKSVTELKSGGWTLAGKISKDTTAVKLAGAKWNAADTYYTVRDKVVPGTEIDPARLEKGSGVWLKRAAGGK